MSEISHPGRDLPLFRLLIDEPTQALSYQGISLGMTQGQSAHEPATETSHRSTDTTMPPRSRHLGALNPEVSLLTPTPPASQSRCSDSQVRRPRRIIIRPTPLRGPLSTSSDRDPWSFHATQRSPYDSVTSSIAHQVDQLIG